MKDDAGLTPSDLANIPTGVLKTFAGQRGIPSSGSPAELRDRIKQTVSLAEVAADPLVAPYLSTDRAQNYRFYRVEGACPAFSALVEKVREAGPGDPFQKTLRPALSEVPAVTSAEVLDDQTLAVDIAFQGEESLVPNGWDVLEVRPPVFARVVCRLREGIIEIRSRRHKLEVIEGWVRDFLVIPAVILTFDYGESMQLKSLLGGTTYSLSKTPKSGNLGLVRLASADIGADVEEDPASLEIDEVLGRVGGSENTNPTLVFWDRTKVRPNVREGSFYIQKHVGENELAQLRAALLTVKKAGSGSLPQAAAADPPGSGTGRRRELKPEDIQGKIAKVKWLTEPQRAELSRIFLSLSLSQQQRLLPGFFASALGLSEDAAGKLCVGLKNAGLLKPFQESVCYNCGGVTQVADDGDDRCAECGCETDTRQQAYRVKGFIRSGLAPDTVFRADYGRLSQLHGRLLASRESDDNDVKKRALEDYMAELFGMLEGITCVDKDSRSSMDEIDLIFQNEQTEHALLKLMSPNFLVLCRNTSNPVNSKEMTGFKESLRSRRLKYGIYVSVNGFTGFKSGGPAAQDCKQVLRDARRDGYCILTLDVSDLEAVVERKRNLPDLLWEKQNATLTY